MWLALSMTHIYTVVPCVTPESETGGTYVTFDPLAGKLPLLLVHRASLESGGVEDVEANHCTAPYCAVKLVDVNGTTPFSPSGPNLKETVGDVVNPDVTSQPKLLFRVGLILLASERA